MDELRGILGAGQVSFSRLLFDHYQDLDLTASEFTVYLFISEFVQMGKGEADMRELAQRTKMRPGDFTAVLSSLNDKGAIRILTKKDDGGRLHDYYDVTPLLTKLLSYTDPQTVNPAATRSQQTSASRQVLNQVETEFGRPLSPIEQQTVRAWLRDDHYSPELVSLALREAVLNQAYSLKYMDRVLLSWEKNNLRTPEAVQRAQRRLDSL